MKFKGLNGRVVAVDLTRRNTCKQHDNYSAGQINLRHCLEEIYSSSNILEDFIIPGERLSLDFFLPSHSVAFEFNGKQHYQYISRFHEDRSDFLKQKSCDLRKEDWCQINDIIMLVIQDTEISALELVELILEKTFQQNESF